MTANDYLVGTHWHDVIVVGAGHNGLLAALLFARKGLKVIVLEERDVLGGVTRTERPFASAPELGVPTGEHRCGLASPQLFARLGVPLPLLRREPHDFFVTDGGKYAAFGSDRARTKELLGGAFSESQARAHDALTAELALLRADLEPACLDEPLSIEATAERWVRAELRSAFVSLCRKPLAALFDRWEIADESLRAMHAASAGLLSWEAPGSGMAYLASAMGQLWEDGARVGVEGGMGAVARLLADRAIYHGAIIETEKRVSSIVVESGITRGVVLRDGTMHHATAILCGTDPFRLREMIGREKLPADYNARLDALRSDGTMLKVCLALSAPPELTCAPRAFDHSGFGPTIHFLPDALEPARHALSRGKLADRPIVTLDVHTAVDETLRDSAGRHAATLVTHAPYELAGTTWKEEEAGYVQHLLALCDRFAPGTSERVVESLALPPPKLEERFGVSRGQLRHIDDAIGFADRAPYTTPVAGLYSCSAATHPSAAVAGAAGHNAAMRILRDLGKPLTAPPSR